MRGRSHHWSRNFWE